jgi:hypothetical protein
LSAILDTQLFFTLLGKIGGGKSHEKGVQIFCRGLLGP